MPANRTRAPSAPSPRTSHPAKGAAIVFLAIVIVPLVLMLALAIDVGIMLISGWQQANNAEFAAIGALEAYESSTPSSIHQRKAIAVEVAERIARQNHLLGRPGVTQVNPHELRDEVAGTVRFGIWDSTNNTFTEVADDVDCNSITVQLWTSPGTSVLTLFGGAMGLGSVNLNSSGRAYYDPSAGSLGKPNYYLVPPS